MLYQELQTLVFIMLQNSLNLKQYFQKMKRVIFLTILSVISIFAISTYFSACTADSCKTRAVECMNGGTCKDGDCICAKGYEGDSCQFKVNKKFNSHYACVRTELINNIIVDDNDDTLRVKAEVDKFKVTVYSLRDSVNEVLNGTVDGNTITIPVQTHELYFTSLSYIYKYYGSGSLNNGVLTLTLYKELQGSTTSMNSKITYVGYKYQ